MMHKVIFSDMVTDADYTATEDHCSGHAATVRLEVPITMLRITFDAYYWVMLCREQKPGWQDSSSPTPLFQLKI
jgi:hypothetical protein